MWLFRSSTEWCLVGRCTQLWGGGWQLAAIFSRAEKKQLALVHCGMFKPKIRYLFFLWMNFGLTCNTLGVWCNSAMPSGWIQSKLHSQNKNTRNARTKVLDFFGTPVLVTQQCVCDCTSPVMLGQNHMSWRNPFRNKFLCQEFGC